MVDGAAAGKVKQQNGGWAKPTNVGWWSGGRTGDDSGTISVIRRRPLLFFFFFFLILPLVMFDSDLFLGLYLGIPRWTASGAAGRGRRDGARGKERLVEEPLEN